MIKLYSKKHENILNYLTEFEGLGFNKIQALFRKKDIKVNGARVNVNFLLNEGDIIEIYSNPNYFFKMITVYEDENIIIVNKPKKLETISETKNICLLNLINPSYLALHRLDFNTEGLVVFAKNETAKNILSNAFKNSDIEKKYITICKNIPNKSEILFEDFLIKNENKVKIYKNEIKNAKKILTKITILRKNQNYSLLDVSLLTGRTHQIRAHLAFHNLPVLGDEKYGDFHENKKLKLKNQILRCYRLKFTNLSKELSYLNNKVFEISTSDIFEMFEKL